MTHETNRANAGASAAVPSNGRATVYLDLLSHRETGSAAISTRRRWPASFPDESLAVAQAIALLKQHSELCGFILVPDGLQAANDAYLSERTITRATMARRARQQRKQSEVSQ